MGLRIHTEVFEFGQQARYTHNSSIDFVNSSGNLDFVSNVFIILRVYACHSVCVEVTGQRKPVIFLLPTCGLRNGNWSHQTWWPTPLPAGLLPTLQGEIILSWFFFFLRLFILCVWVYCLHVCLCRRAPGTEVILVVRHHVNAGNWTWVLLQEHQMFLS